MTTQQIRKLDNAELSRALASARNRRDAFSAHSTLVEASDARALVARLIDEQSRRRDERRRTLTTSDFKIGERVLVGVPDTKIELYGTIVDASALDCASDEIAVRFDGQCAAFAPTKISYVRATLPAA